MPDWGVFVSIASIVIMGSINAGIMLKGQRVVEASLGELKEWIRQLDADKLDKNVHVEVVKRIDAELVTARGELQSVRHQTRNIEQRLMPVPTSRPNL